MVDFDRVCKKYDNWNILKDVTFHIERGEFVFLTGPSGVGKSTILRLVLMAEFPTSGRVRVDQFHSNTIRNKEIPYLRRRLGIIFQDFKLIPQRTVFENVAFALAVTGAKKGEIKRRTLNALSSVGLYTKRNAMPVELSGGEQQRVAIARALVNEPFLLLADEPTGNLDGETATSIYQLLNDVNSKGTSVLAATHDENWARGFPHRILRLQDGIMRE